MIYSKNYKKKDFPFNLLRDLSIERTDLPEKLPKDFIASIIYLIYQLDERECHILLRKYQGGLTNVELGEELHISRTRVMQIHHKALCKLKHEKRHKIIIKGINKYLDDFINQEVETRLMDIKENDLLNLDINSKEFLNTNIDKLLLSTRAYNCLYRLDIKTIQDILDHEEDIAGVKIRNMGLATSNEIIHKMRLLGFIRFGTIRIL